MRNSARTKLRLRHLRLLRRHKALAPAPAPAPPRPPGLLRRLLALLARPLGGTNP